MPQSLSPQLSSDEQAFLCEAIQRLCSSLKPEAAVAAFYETIARVLPLRSFSLLSSSPEDIHPGQVVCVAQVSDNGIVCPLRRIDLSPESRAFIQQVGLFEPDNATEFDLQSEDSPLFRYLNIFPEPLAAPLFVVRLLKEHALGTAHFAGKSLFTEAHKRLMRGLEAPLCIAMGNILQHHELEEIRGNILRDNQRLRQQLQGFSHVEVIGASGGLATVMRKARQAAPVNVPVLITGETGTGKEVMARALHDLSPRKRKPFVAVNCAALPPTLMDSELFGVTRGAFTGATETRKGYFERADKGTIFLDEIGELPPDAQSRLLRVLETGEVHRLGGQAAVSLDVRLVAATNRDLPRMVEEGTFRRDLYFRLRVVSLALPPLRERRADIPELVQFLLERSAARFGVVVPQLAQLAEGEMEKLLAHHWPGNVRELQDVLDEALICSEGRRLRVSLPHSGPSCAVANSTATEKILNAAPCGNTSPQQHTQSYDETVRNYFAELLRHTNGRVSGPHGAALLAGLKPSTFRFKCTRLGLLQKLF